MFSSKIVSWESPGIHVLGRYNELHGYVLGDVAQLFIAVFRVSRHAVINLHLPVLFAREYSVLLVRLDLAMREFKEHNLLPHLDVRHGR